MQPKILVPVADTKTTRRTLDALIQQKNRFPTEVTLLHVVNLEKMEYRMIPDFQIEMVKDYACNAGERLVKKLAEELTAAGMQVATRLEFGSPRDTICKVANDENFDLLILGRKWGGEIRDMLFGSVANHVLHHVRCPVLLF